MKKLLAVLLILTLSLSLVACGSSTHAPVVPNSGTTAGEKEEALQEETEIEEVEEEQEPSYEGLFALYEGKYRAIECISDGEDITEFVQSSWEDKTFYQWMEFDTEGVVKFRGYSESSGGLQDYGVLYFDPVEFRFYGTEDRTGDDYVPIEMDGDTFTFDLGTTYYKFLKTDEIQDFD
ncbi:MAG: hypothetical protein IJ091_08380 [Oscillospiraceae bacterium]|nr:hypothetical protein [Oscillospiraceae bacterium]